MKFSAIALTVALAFPAFGANLAGKAVFKGKAPKTENIKMDADPVCKKANATPVAKGDVVVSGKGDLANVFVYVKEGAKKEAIPADKPAPMTFDQAGCIYHPRVFGVRTGQAIKILNSDPTLHNVHAMPKVNPGFNMGMATKGQSIEKTFTKPETMVRVKCDVHGWMLAYVGVMDHPWFATTDANGSFSIANLPPGEYTLEAWHEKLGTKTAKVTVTEAGASAPVEFAFGGQG
jgi:plastocyanin